MPEKHDWIIRIRFYTVAAILACGSGCMLGPDYTRPATPADQAERYVHDDGLLNDPNDIQAIGQWWKRFDDPVTNELVETALNSNLDILASAARVKESRALLAQAKGKYWPEISYNFNRDRSKNSFNSPSGRMSFLSTTFSQDLSISYVADLFGKIRRSDEAAFRDLLATEADRMALIHGIVAQVVLTRARIATLQRQVAIAKANQNNWQEALDVVERRYKLGLVEPLDVRLAKENLAYSQSTQLIFQQTLYTTQHSLDVLLGRRPGAGPAMPDTLPDLPDPKPIPGGLPADLLDRRPDLRQSEMQLAAATSRVGVSIAHLFPDLTLTAGYGFRSDEFRDLLSSEAEVYSAVIRLTQPIFRGGQLRAQVKAAKARAEQAAAHYAASILNALREVEDALVQEQMLRQQVAVLNERLTEARAAERLARQQYQKGLSKLLVVLETERRRRNAETELAATKGELWTNRVELFLALGGDWQIDPDTPLHTNEAAEHDAMKIID